MLGLKSSKRLKGDVPVTSRIGWRPHQDLLSVRRLSIRVIDAELYVLNTDAVIEYSVAGTLSPFFHGHAWRPLIESMQISERMTSDPEPLGDILLVPIVGVRSDKRYDGRPVEFEVSVRSLVSSYRWQRNRYRVTCGGLVEYFDLTQLNKDGQQDAPPNGDPATGLGNSGVAAGPPSVS
jgi:hypothetical protein